jgi:single-strand DNA-binding protein
MNNFTAIGHIGRDAVTRFTQGGKAVTSWPLAVSKGWGENKQTVWLDCALWGERGQKLADMIRKGDRLGVTGEIGTREHDGKTYVTLEVREVTLLGEKRQEASQPARAASTKSSRPDPANDFVDDDLPF